MPYLNVLPAQEADAAEDAAQRLQEAGGQALPLQEERSLGGDAAGDTAGDVPPDAFAAVEEALGQPPTRQRANTSGKQ